MTGCILHRGYETTGVCTDCGEEGLRPAAAVDPQPPAQDWFHVKGEMRRDDHGWTVEFHWVVDEVRLDRPYSGGISCGRNPRLALRLQAAVNAGVVHKDMVLRTDIYGKTYVQSTCLVSGRYLVSDLTSLGY